MKTDQIRLQLLDRRNQLSKRQSKIRADRRRSAEPLDPDFSEQAVQRENDETLDFLDTRLRSELAEIEAAIGRIDAGGFGVCERCAEAIPERRLELLPTTSICAACASSLDAQGPEQR